MINNQKCENCKIADICVAKAKLKPFSEDARTDLEVVLDFVACKNFTALDEEETFDDEDETEE